jgi:hypothetical protein
MQTSALVEQDEAASFAERRRFQRVRLSLLGRFMLENRREYPCQTIDVSPGSCALIAPVPGIAGERIIAYIDHIGRIEGRIVRFFDGGFAMTVEGTSRKRDKLAAKLTWLANRYHLNLAEDRRHERVAPSTSRATITLPDSRTFDCRITDLSLSGAALATDANPPIGSPVRLGAIRALVVRHSEEGLGVEFAIQQTPDSLEDGLAARAT